MSKMFTMSDQFLQSVDPFDDLGLPIVAWISGAVQVHWGVLKADADICWPHQI